MVRFRSSLSSPILNEDVLMNQHGDSPRWLGLCYECFFFVRFCWKMLALMVQLGDFKSRSWWFSPLSSRYHPILAKGVVMNQHCGSAKSLDFVKSCCNSWKTPTLMIDLGGFKLWFSSTSSLSSLHSHWMCQREPAWWWYAFLKLICWLYTFTVLMSELGGFKWSKFMVYPLSHHIVAPFSLNISMWTSLVTVYHSAFLIMKRIWWKIL